MTIDPCQIIILELNVFVSSVVDSPPIPVSPIFNSLTALTDQSTSAVEPGAAIVECFEA